MTLLRDDRKLLDGFRTGEPAALRRIYDAYVGDVERAALRGFRHGDGELAVRVRSTDDLADVVQEVFVRVFSPPARMAYDGLREFRPYLLTVARNVVADRFRQRAKEVALATLPSLPDAPTAGPDEQESEPDSRMLASTEQYLAGLTPELSQLHHARFVVGLSQEAAAKRLASSRQRIRTLEQRLRDGLREWLKEQGFSL